jgi:hypothetical protein
MKIFRLLTLSALLSLGSSAMAEDAPRPATTSSATQKKTEAKPGAKPDSKAASGKAAPHANDQLTLDATLVTGNRELPKVMYIVPWKKAELSTLPGQPFNTLIDEALAPVDREVFRREVAYYDVVADKDHAGTQSASGAQATSGADKK